MMSTTPKQFVTMLAGLQLGTCATLDKFIRAAQGIEMAGKLPKLDAEGKKNAKDVEKANASISALDHIVESPERIRFKTIGDSISPALISAILAEKQRLQTAIENPPALKRIFRRKET